MKHFILFLALILAACDGGSNPSQPSTQFPFSTKTPGGAQILSVVEIPDNVKVTIDQGLQAQIDRLPANYTTGRSISDYRIRFTYPQAENGDGSPALLVGDIQTAGTVKDQRTNPYILLPHQAATNWRYVEYLHNSVWYESEHYSDALHAKRINNWSEYERISQLEMDRQIQHPLRK